MSTSTTGSIIPEGGELASYCDKYIIESPLPKIIDGPYPPLYEFITQNWDKTKTNATTNDNNKEELNVDNNTTTTTDINTKYNENINPKIVPKHKVCIIDIATGLQRTFYEQEMTATKLASYLLTKCNIEQNNNNTSTDTTTTTETTNTHSVAMFCPNHVDYLPICLGVALCGFKITPINPVYTIPELITVLTKSQSSVLVVHVSKYDTAVEAIKDIPAIKNIIIITDNDDNNINNNTDSKIEIEKGINIVTLSSIRNDIAATRVTQSPKELLLVSGSTSNYPFCVPYSSGTSGIPKGVCLSHQNTISNLLQCNEIENMYYLSHHTLICPLPFFHIYAFTVSMLYSAWQGQTIITSSGRFDIEQFCSAVQQYQPTRAHLVPPIMLGLAKHPIIDQYNISSLKTIVSAAAPLSADIEQLVIQRLNNTCIIKQGWGMSELSPIGAYSTDATTRSGSVGTLIPSTYGKIIDPDTGLSLPSNTPGELCIKGPQVMMGYLNEPDKTAECLSSNGWLRTGDIALYDTDGYIFITDRIKELIKVNGFQVAPAELESLLNTNVYVADAAVIAIPHDTMGEVPRAYIILKDEVVVTTNDTNNNISNEIYDWIAERVAPYKRLKGGIVIVSSIPKSVSGKILRRLLKDEYVVQLQQQKQEQKLDD